MDPCPLCYKTTFIQSQEGKYQAACESRCLQKVTNLVESEEAAIQDFERFKLELSFGAEMWESKIRDGIAEE